LPFFDCPLPILFLASGTIGNRQSAIGMYLIVGLGNPGAEYEWSRHNLGFMLIDKLASDARVNIKRRECQSLVGSALIEAKRVRLVKPQTYMNLSGEAVGCLVKKGEVSNDALIVISDDLALPFGTIRLRARGSAGGHNGLKSIIAALGTNEFVRLRIGIQPDHPVMNAKSFVLDEVPRSQRPAVTEILERGVEALRCVLRDGIAKGMSIYN
jgi:PTH1 family peptidyl-tRNA hydrolase